jgi:YD repeat-containing protein
MGCLLPRPGAHVLVDGDGGVRYFARNADGSYISPPDLDASLVGLAQGSFGLFGPGQRSRHFDAHGRLTRTVDEHGRTTTYRYDDCHQPVQRTGPDGRVHVFLSE